MNKTDDKTSEVERDLQKQYFHEEVFDEGSVISLDHTDTDNIGGVYFSCSITVLVCFLIKFVVVGMYIGNKFVSMFNGLIDGLIQYIVFYCLLPLNCLMCHGIGWCYIMILWILWIVCDDSN